MRKIKKELDYLIGRNLVSPTVAAAFRRGSEFLYSVVYGFELRVLINLVIRVGRARWGPREAGGGR